MVKKQLEPVVVSRQIPGFRRGVDSVPCHYLVLTPDFTIVSVSNVFLQNTMTMRGDIIGRNIFDVFPDNPNDPMAHGVAALKASFMRVLESKLVDVVQLLKYDIPKPRSKTGFEERYWHPVNFPLFDKAGNLSHIVHNSEDVTRVVGHKQPRHHASAVQA